MMAKLRRWARIQLNRLRSRYYRTLFAFDSDDLVRELRAAGLEDDDVVMVHSSFDSFRGFTGRPSDVIGALRRAVGTGGTLLMPAMPFTGSALDYIAGAEVFDLKRTPSRMGLISEIFRRTRGAIRSAHPTHSVVASGPRAGELISDHHLATTPCGKPSPYQKLCDLDGKLLLLGTGLGALTFYHYLEEVIEDRMPRTPFTEEFFERTVKTVGGDEYRVRMRLFDREMSARRRLDALESRLRLEDRFSSFRVGGLDAILLRAREVKDTVNDMADEGIFCYAGIDGNRAA